MSSPLTMFSLTGPVLTTFGGTLPVSSVRPILTSSRACVSGGSPSIMAMRRALDSPPVNTWRQRALAP